MTRLGVLGWPVAHSRSPAMHNAALAALGLEGWRYQRLPAPPELLDELVRALPAAGFVGANVTIPHKQAALALADSASVAAREIGAANTLSFAPGGEIAAENTDAPGLIAALERAGRSPRGQSALVLGAGGSARAAVWALREAGAREVSVCNRTRERAIALADALGARVVPLPERADILINCTSVGLVRPSGGGDGDLNQLRLSLDLVGRYSYVVDLVYTDGDTPLLAAAREREVATLDGLEILVAQGALSLEVWTGCPAPLDVMRSAAREPDGGDPPDEDAFLLDVEGG
ncbi:MAG TPA: shikimate dehydrogenase [Solirubrobacteraceae bacterium]|jgi:shikimate dehydrogenase|nr:shikimate dehydrogenase [Solirubrobacteraceae bacterium]